MLLKTINKIGGIAISKSWIRLYRDTDEEINTFSCGIKSWKNIYIFDSCS